MTTRGIWRPPSEAEKYEAEMGRKPPAPPNPETERQYKHRPGRDDPREYMSDRDPGDEQDAGVVIDGQEGLL